MGSHHYCTEPSYKPMMVSKNFNAKPGYFDLSLLPTTERARYIDQISIILWLGAGMAAELKGNLLQNFEAARQALIHA